MKRWGIAWRCCNDHAHLQYKRSMTVTVLSWYIWGYFNPIALRLETALLHLFVVTSRAHSSRIYTYNMSFYAFPYFPFRFLSHYAKCQCNFLAAIFLRRIVCNPKNSKSHMSLVCRLLVLYLLYIFVLLVLSKQ